MIGLTPLQRDFLAWLGDNPRASVRQMALALDIPNHSRVQALLDRLEERGWIARTKHVRGSLRILRRAPVRLRPVPIANVPARPATSEPPTPFWDYPDHTARRCSEWLQAEAA